jgi:putative ABC transport system ATP-binding protein
VIKDFSLSIKAGEVVCLLGTNGSGKTTLVNMLTGLEKLDEEKGNAFITTKNGQ